MRRIAEKSPLGAPQPQGPECDNPLKFEALTPHQS
jgi:hypothetical protein